MSIYFSSNASKQLPALYADTIGLFNNVNIPSITEAQRNDNPTKVFKNNYFFGYNTDHVHNWAFTPHPLRRQNELSYN